MRILGIATAELHAELALKAFKAGKHVYVDKRINWADATNTSFFPARPLGCYGHVGAALTNDEELFYIVDSLRVHGKAVKCDLVGKTFEYDTKYLNMRVGMNSRLGTIQASVLLEKLSVLSEEIETRNLAAKRHRDGLGDVVTVPQMIDRGVSTGVQYTIELPNRHGLAAFSKSLAVPNTVYYPTQIHKHDPYSRYPLGPGGLTVREENAGKVISLPMLPYLDTENQDYIIATVCEFAGRNEQ